MSWLQKGVKFACVECGKCCKGSRTNVYINAAEIGAMADHLGLDVANFVEKYAEDRSIDGTGTTTSLKNVGGGCALLSQEDRKTCLVHEVKPTQCRTYPFWASSLVSKAEFDAEAQRCPGIGEGESVDEHDILRQMVVNQIHARGVGENWVHDEAMALIKEAEELEPRMLSDFSDEFFGENSSRVVHEGEEIRVVESTVSGQKTSRRLEFKSSLSMIQSEVYLKKDGTVDHTSLALPVHAALASVVKAAGLSEGASHVAMIGGGACALPSHLLHTHNTTSKRLLLDVVEPHKEVSQVAATLFDAKFASSDSVCQRDGGMRLVETTGEEYLRNQKDLSLDVLVVDAMDSLPLSVFTHHEEDKDLQEYIAPAPAILEKPAELLRSLTSKGILVVNLYGPMNYTLAVHRMLTFTNGGKGSDEGPDAGIDHMVVSIDTSPNMLLVVMRREPDEEGERDREAKMRGIASSLVYGDSLPFGAQVWRLNAYGEREALPYSLD